MAVDPKAASSYVDPSYGSGNPYDPETEPILWQQWNNQHPSGYTTNDSDTPTDWRGIALTTAAGVAPFVAQGLFGGAAAGGSEAGGASSSAAPYGLGDGVGLAPEATPTLGAGLGASPSGLAATLGPTSTLGAAPAAPAVSAAAPAMSGATYDTGFVGPMAKTAGAAGTGGGIWSQFFKDHGADIAGGTANYFLQRSANKDAIAAQQAAAQQAIQTQQRIAAAAYANNARVGQQQRALYDTSQQNLAPFTSLGGGAASALGSALGIPVNMPKPVNIPTDLAQAPNLNVGTEGVMNPRSTPGPNPFPGSQPFNPSFNPASTGGTTSSIFAPKTGQKVKMRAPDGTTEDVELKDVPHYKSLGAVVLS